MFTARQHFEIPSRRVSIPAERHDFLSQLTHSTSTFAYVHSSNATSFSAESHFKIINSLFPHPWNAVDFAARPHSQLRNPYNHPNRTPRCFQSTKISPFQGFATPQMSIRQSAMTTWGFRSALEFSIFAGMPGVRCTHPIQTSCDATCYLNTHKPHVIYCAR